MKFLIFKYLKNNISNYPYYLILFCIFLFSTIFLLGINFFTYYYNNVIANDISNRKLSINIGNSDVEKVMEKINLNKFVLDSYIYYESFNLFLNENNSYSINYVGNYELSNILHANVKLEKNEVVISKTLSNKGYNVGDSLTLYNSNDRYTFHVSYISNDNSSKIYVAESILSKILNISTNNDDNSIIVILKNIDNVNDFISNINNENFEVSISSNATDSVSHFIIVNYFKILVSFLILIMLIICIFIMKNILIKEKDNIFTLNSLGYSRKKTLRLANLGICLILSTFFGIQMILYLIVLIFGMNTSNIVISFLSGNIIYNGIIMFFNLILFISISMIFGLILLKRYYFYTDNYKSSKKHFLEKLSKK